MASRKQSALDRILGHLDDLDTVNLTALVQRLARERKLLETIFHTIHDGILVIDTSGIIQYANTASSRLIGLKSSDIGKAILWKIVPDLARSLEIAVKGPAITEEPTAVITREIELNYPEHRFIRLIMVPLNEQIAVGSERGYAIILSDTTETRETTEEMIENEKIASIMNLAAGVAHELGNPLNSLNIHLQLLRRRAQALGESEGGRIEQSVEICLNEVKRLDGIIENFLDAVRPRDPNLVELNVIDVLGEVLAVQEHELANLKIEINVQSDQNLPTILADPQQLFQVFFNIIKNAAEATEAGGTIDIRTSRDDTHVFIQFKDTGSGIEPEDMSRVFQPYFTTKTTGHGIGMMIVQRILRAHGAKIGIDSIPGIGTAVTLQFLRKGPRTRLLDSPI